MELDYLKEDKYKDYYGEDLPYIEKAMELVYEKIKNSGEEFGEEADRNPVEHIKYRVKSPRSAKEKLKKLELEDDDNTPLNNLHDICGFRIICTFISDVEYIINEIKKISEVKIVVEKDYINKPKKNGYRSYHIIVKLPVDIDGVIKEIYIEAQVRTIAMDCWASLEHQLMYKKDIKNKDLFKDELKKCADEMATTDLNLETIMSFIKSEGV